MAAGDDARCAIVGAIVVEKDQSIDHVSWPLRRHVAMQGLMTTAAKGFAAFYLRKKETLANQFAHDRQHLR